MSASEISWFDRMPEYADASEWRDMTNGERLAERAAKTGLIVLALLLAIGTAVAIHYGLQATVPTFDWYGRLIGETSLAPIATIPAVLGSAGIITLLIFAYKLNFEKRKSGSAPEDTKAGALDAKRDQLRGTLKQVYDLYHHANGGLRTLVEGGVIATEQATQLSALLRNYHASHLVMKDYHSRDNAERVKQHPEEYDDYNRAKSTLEDLERQWKQIQTNCVQHSMTKNPSRDATN